MYSCHTQVRAIVVGGQGPDPSAAGPAGPAPSAPLPRQFSSPADRRLGRRSRPDPKALPVGYGMAFREKVDCSNVQLTGKRSFEMFIIERTTGK